MPKEIFFIRKLLFTALWRGKCLRNVALLPRQNLFSQQQTFLDRPFGLSPNRLTIVMYKLMQIILAVFGAQCF